MTETTATRDVFLLRGINVGGHGRLPMAWLREAALTRGATAAETYLASGNLIVTLAPAVDAGTFLTQLRARIAQAHGFEPPILHVTANRMRTAAQSVPYPVPVSDLKPDLKHVHIAFLGAAADPQAVATLTSRDFGDDRVTVIDDCAYLWYPNGAHGSRLTLERIERDLNVTGTARNLATVRALVERVSPR